MATAILPKFNPTRKITEDDLLQPHTLVMQARDLSAKPMTPPAVPIRSEIEDLIQRLALPHGGQIPADFLTKLRQSDASLAQEAEQVLNNALFAAVEAGFRLGWRASREPEILIFND